MAEEKTLEVKTGEEETPAGEPQPEEQTTEPEETAEETTDETTEEEIDEVLEEKAEVEDLGDGTINLSKKEWDKVNRERDNYKKGLLSVKKKIKKPKPAEVPQNSDYLTKTDFYKSNEKIAIKKVCENEEINKNWKDIIPFYVSRRGKDTIEDIVSDVEDAFVLFQKHNPSKEGEAKEVKSDLSTEDQKPEEKTEKQGEKKNRKRILSEDTNVNDWYE